MSTTHPTHGAPAHPVALPSSLANLNGNVLDDAILMKLVDPDVYYAFARCRATGLPMDSKLLGCLGEIYPRMGAVERMRRVFALVFTYAWVHSR